MNDTGDKETLEMDLTQDYRQAGRRCLFRPAGVATAGELAHLIADALSQARTQGLREALVDITAASGFESPGPAFRRWAVGLWAEKVGADLSVAMVARREHICPDKTGLLVAAEEGLNANVFDDGAAAVARLDAESRGPARDGR